eukprot:203367-Rhodomonas_salina.2
MATRAQTTRFQSTWEEPVILCLVASPLPPYEPATQCPVSGMRAGCRRFGSAWYSPLPAYALATRCQAPATPCPILKLELLLPDQVRLEWREPKSRGVEESHGDGHGHGHGRRSRSR